MSIAAAIANILRRLVENKEEMDEPSGGFLPFRVRQKAISLVGKKGRLLDIGCGEGLF